MEVLVLKFLDQLMQMCHDVQLLCFDRVLSHFSVDVVESVSPYLNHWQTLMILGHWLYKLFVVHCPCSSV